MNPDIDDLLFALHSAAKQAPGGIPAMARTMGLREVSLHQKLNPHDEALQPKLAEAISIMSIAQSTRPLELLCQMFDGQFVTDARADADSILAAALQAAMAHRDIPSALDAAIASRAGSIQGNLAIRHELARLDEVMSAWRAAIANRYSLVPEQPV